LRESKRLVQTCWIHVAERHEYRKRWLMRRPFRMGPRERACRLRTRKRIGIVFNASYTSLRRREAFLGPTGKRVNATKYRLSYIEGLCSREKRGGSARGGSLCCFRMDPLWGALVCFTEWDLVTSRPAKEGRERPGV